MRVRRAALILIGLTTAAVAACSSTGIPGAQSSSARASVTQTAPSVWSAPETSTAQPGVAGSTADAAGSASSTSELPGLSTACSAAVRTQLAMNDLFSAALNVGDGTRASNSPAVTPTAAAVATEDHLANITQESVTEVFDSLTPSIPATLAKPLATLRDAADSIVGKTVAQVPTVLNSAKNLEAARAFSDYIASCEPATTP